MIEDIPSYFLVTYLCTSPALDNCEQVISPKPMLDHQCEVLSSHILETAKKLELKETVLTICTENKDEAIPGIEAKTKSVSFHF